MKKFISAVFLLFACFQTQFIVADDCCDNNSWFGNCFDNCGCCCEDFNIEGRFAAFVPFEHKVRKIYNDFLPSVEVETSMRVWDCFSAFFNASYVWNTGHSLGVGNKTQLQIVPLSLGLKWVQPWICDIDVYLGAGATYSFLRIHDHSPFVHEHVNKQAWGGTAKAGFIYHYTSCLFFEGFVDYIYTRFNFHESDDTPYVERNDLNMSGIKFGVGVGYNF